MNKENILDFDPKLDYVKAKELYDRANAAIWELESMFKENTVPRYFAFQARVSLGHTEDNILRVLGIRGN